MMFNDSEVDGENLECFLTACPVLSGVAFDDVFREKKEFLHSNSSLFETLQQVAAGKAETEHGGLF